VIKLKSQHIILFSTFLILFTSCTPEKQISKINLTENLSNFTSKMTDKDTIEIDVNLTMEWWIRIDRLTLTKRNNSIILNTLIREDTTFQMKNEFRINKLSEKRIRNDDLSFERHFVDNLKKSKFVNEYEWIYKIIHKKDTLTFYTKNLGDKGNKIGEYYKFMSNYYNNEKEFKEKYPE
jgi:hypothetical protein